jgi:MSHA type pilus biogenesis protein MshL
MRNRFILIALMCVFSSCAHVERAAEPPKVVKPVDIASPVSLQMEKEKGVEVFKSKEMFSFSFREADVKDILRAISKQINYNVVMEPDVKGTCTVDLKNVTLEKALEYILEPLNFTYKIEERTIYVSKPKLEARIFHLNYLTLKKIGTSTVVGTIGSQAGTTGGTGTTGTTGTTDSTVSIKSESESDIWKNLEDNLKNLISKDGKFVVNRQAMMVFATDYPKYLKDIGLFLQAAENVIHRQVMIEARIVEVTLNDESREGINWRFIDARIGEFAARGQQVLLNPLPAVPPIGTTAYPAGIPYFRFFVGSKNLDINNTFIDLLRTQGTVNVVSSPKIATLNNQRAIIKVATQDVYFDEQQSIGVGGVPLATYTPKFITVGLILDVTPQIDGNGNIILHIHPMLTDKISVETSPLGSQVPVLDVREADTIVRMKDGETVVIGGLIKNAKRTETTGTKGLMSIPLLGKLFKVETEKIQKIELVVFLTPRIMQSEEKP